MELVMADNKKLIIVATYNERGNIEKLVNEIFSFVPDVNILIIDDNSPDKTYELVEELQQTKYLNKLFLLKRAGKLGLGTAYVAGFHWAIDNNYDVVLHMDADFSHNPKYLPDFFNLIKTNDVVVGSRYIAGGGVRNWNLIRRLISRGGSIYSRIILGLPFKDITSGFKCFRCEVLHSIEIDKLISTGFCFQVETLYKSYLKGYKIQETPIIFEDRVVGTSKMSSGVFIEALFAVIKLRLGLKQTIKNSR
jgi:dolichol-phosphate mannosyltransferase